MSPGTETNGRSVDVCRVWISGSMIHAATAVCIAMPTPIRRRCVGTGGEETDFTAEAAEAMISDIAERREEFLIGAFRKEQMIGCVMVLKEGNHIKFRHKAGIGIFILQKYCGIGLGRQLMEYAIENARKTELEQLKLGVFDDNVAAIRLYEKLGFREWGREPHAFKLKDGSYRDEIQMVLFLS